MAEKAAHSHAIDEAFRTASLFSVKELQIPCWHILYGMVAIKRTKSSDDPAKIEHLAQKINPAHVFLHLSNR